MNPDNVADSGQWRHVVNEFGSTRAKQVSVLTPGSDPTSLHDIFAHPLFRFNVDLLII